MQLRAMTRGWMGERSDPDADLVERLAAGDRDALERLYARYGRPLFSYLVDLVGDRGLAEEIVQDTFVAAWRGGAAFEGRSSVSTWLFGIARRQARDRQRGVRPETMPLDELRDESEEPRPDAEVLAAADRADLVAALDRLPVHHREPLVLAFAHGLSGPEIASVLGIPEGTVKSRLHAARAALRAHLEPEVVG